MKYRQFAKEVAAQVGGVAKKNDRNIHGEPEAEYRVCTHDEKFWITSRLAERKLVYRANHKRGRGEKILFAAAFRHTYLGFMKVLPTLSSSWSIPIFGCWDPETEIAGLELMDRLHPAYRDWIAGLDFDRFHFCDIQTSAIVHYKSADDAARIILKLNQFMADVDCILNEIDPEKRA